VLTVTTCESPAWQPFTSVTVTEYVVVPVGVTVMVCEVCPPGSQA
jgi:hypothetical protein